MQGAVYRRDHFNEIRAFTTSLRSRARAREPAERARLAEAYHPPDIALPGTPLKTRGL